MSNKLKEQARALGAQIAAAENDVKEGRVKLSGMMAAAVEEGTIGTKAFNDAYEEASRPVDALAEEIAEKRRSWASIMNEIGEGTPSALPVEGQASHEAQSFGERFVTSESYRALLASHRLEQERAQIGVTDAVRMTNGVRDVKALLTSAGYPLVPQREAGAVSMPQVAISILDLITIGSTNTEIVEFVQQKTRTNNAAAKAEGALAAESTFDYEVKQIAVQEIAHFHVGTKRSFRDEGQLRTLIDQELMDGLRVKLQDLIIGGDGIAPNLRGIHNTTGLLSQAKGTDTWADAIHKAVTKVRIGSLGQIEPGVIGIHPTDFEAHALAKDTNGNYIAGGPNSNGPATIWGLKPIVSTAYPLGNPLVGDFRQATLWIWSDVAISLSDQNEDYWKKGLVGALASFGGAFGVKRPYGFCEIA